MYTYILHMYLFLQKKRRTHHINKTHKNPRRWSSSSSHRMACMFAYVCLRDQTVFFLLFSLLSNNHNIKNQYRSLCCYLNWTLCKYTKLLQHQLQQKSRLLHKMWFEFYGYGYAYKTLLSLLRLRRWYMYTKKNMVANQTTGEPNSIQNWISI